MTEIKEICTNHCRDYCYFWNIADLITIINNWCIILMLILQFVTLNKIDLVSVDNYSSLLYAHFLMNIESHFLFISGMLYFFRIFKYFEFSRRLTAVFDMMGRATLDISIFMFVIGICIFAFSIGGFIMFGSNVWEFSTITVCTQYDKIGHWQSRLSTNFVQHKFEHWIF